jgi:hypothetical protein
MGLATAAAWAARRVAGVAAPAAVGQGSGGGWKGKRLAPEAEGMGRAEGGEEALKAA